MAAYLLASCLHGGRGQEDKNLSLNSYGDCNLISVLQMEVAMRNEAAGPLKQNEAAEPLKQSEAAEPLKQR